ncbi:glycine--tRNA ligase subunit beta [Qingshengfaniella alkalisoli]|uniref:Glycine--tRNA ligase beta subunit n=1 Tax=Qingshengfaniella alkalisoli TaxID=2599296 RepID=A0A5B8IUL8_9RHOB|nr:glycine--tRNA ligase subunit beta [Qingshengfaniella alkalisoli]QDY69123.1 glycine--tRNA ligase subunit beta [Qingshengfaniella alkalisoli]
MPDLLIELFSEEIPARMQAKAAADLKRLVTNGIVEAGLTYTGAGAFHTPRRLVLTVQGMASESPTTREERKGPRVGAPEKALEGFLRSTGLTRDQLEARDDKKGQVWFATVTREGRPAAEIVAEVLSDTIRNFPWPKSMRWGSDDLRWVRPLHSILCITHDEGGAEVVPLEVGGITSGRTVRGHRFMAPAGFEVSSFEDYRGKLKRAHVVLDANERAEHIKADAENMAFASGLELVEDNGLLAEVAGLVEWPVVLMGEIGAEFLDLPPEVLQTSMKEHQKFFSIRNPKTGRIERFITVANRETADDGATILAGNQKVLAARLSDAKFFWENDLRTIQSGGLEGMGKPLADVTFHNRLGSQADRIARIATLAREIAPIVGAEPQLAGQAARIAKVDLSSEMVYEFPELQGIMGRYYGKFADLPDAVSDAAQFHYQPLGPSDDVPRDPVSVAVALADKIDTLTGFWAIDEKPTGSKDPFALRRAALGVIRLILANQLRVSLLDVWLAPIRANRAAMVQAGAFEEGRIPDLSDERVEKECALVLAGDLLAFFHDRLKVYLRDQGIPHDVIDACLSMPGNDDLTLLVKRAESLSAFLKSDDGENLVQGFKRANNILTQAEDKDGVEYSFGPDVKLAETNEERSLFAALDSADGKIGPAMRNEDFASAMSAMSELRTPIDAFFEAVQVNSDNQVVRRNRLNLLHRIRATCSQVADLTRLGG